jgi:ATP-binding cassette subfamily C (CFTR/MRP) protein 1
LDIFFAAKRLPYADHIIALGSDGRISEQGDFRELSSSGGYTSSFNLPPPEWTYNSGYEEPAISKQTSILPASVVPTKTSTEDLTRRIGDLSVYLYYINAVGWLPSLVFVFAISSFVFCISFPGKIWIGINLLLSADLLPSHMGKMVGCCKPFRTQ